MVDARTLIWTILSAEKYLDNLYREVIDEFRMPNKPSQVTKFGIISEYPSTPIIAEIIDEGGIRYHPIGFGDLHGWEKAVFFQPIWSSYWKLHETIKDDGTCFEWIIGNDTRDDRKPEGDFDYDEPKLQISYEPSNSSIELKVRVLDYKDEQNKTVNLYLVHGGELIKLFEGIRNNSIPDWTVSLRTSENEPFPSLRFAVRHISQMGWKHYYWDSLHPNALERAENIKKLLDYYDFIYDLYDPLWHNSDGYRDDFIWTVDVYHELFIYDYLPGADGQSPTHYPYRSKIGGPDPNITVVYFIFLNFTDPLWWSLEAIHLMNKYNDPYKKVLQLVGPVYIQEPVSAYDIIRKGVKGCYIPCDTYVDVPPLEQRWVEGVGVEWPEGNFSAIRLGTFLVAEAEFGYGFGDETAKRYADKAAEILPMIQWKGRADETEDHGVVYRPEHKGGFMIYYTRANGFKFKARSMGILGTIADLFNMPNEFFGEIPTHAESTIVAQRAARIYLWYKFKGGKGSFPSCLCLADLNNDQKVNIDDLLLAYRTIKSGGYCVFADLNMDGVLDEKDFEIIRGALREPIKGALWIPNYSNEVQVSVA